MKRIYLDVCTLCRPFDNQSMMRIRLETDAYYLILKSIQNRTFDIIVSPVHFKEIEAIEDIYERIELTVLLNRYGKKLSFQLNEIKRRTEDLYSLNFGIADAAHVAFAESAADYFITCDNKLLKKIHKLKGINMEAINPVNFCIKENLR